jgi:hypothetical protein
MMELSGLDSPAKNCSRRGFLMTGKENPEYVALTAQALEEDRALMKAMEPPPPPPPPVLTTEQQAGALHTFAPGAYLYGVTGAVLGPSMKVPGCGAYLDELTRQAGSTTDPIEQMLVQQLVWAYHAIGVLHVQAGSSKRAAEVTAYHAAVARLMAEFRRSSLALQAYRQGRQDRRGGKGSKRAGRPRTVPAPAANGHAEAHTETCLSTELGTNNRLKGCFDDCEPEASLP